MNTVFSGQQTNNNENLNIGLFRMFPNEMNDIPVQVVLTVYQCLTPFIRERWCTLGNNIVLNNNI